VRIALDTNAYSDFCRGNREIVEKASQADRVYLPFVVLAELRAGFLGGTRASANERNLQRFLNTPRVRALLPDDQTTHQFAKIAIQLRRQATPIPEHDMWIAALVMQHDLELVSRDAHFDHLPKLPRL